MKTVWNRYGFFAVVLAFVLVVTGCEDKRRHKTSEDVEFAAAEALPTEADAETVARSFLESVKTLQEVRVEGLGVEGNAEKYDKAMGRLIGMADSKRIYDKVRPHNGNGSIFVPTDITESAAVRHVVSLWVSKIAHYVSGLEWDTLKVKDLSDGAKGVSLIATNPIEREKLADILARYEKNAGNDAPEKGPKEYWAAIRKMSLAEGFNVPIEATITVELHRAGKTWRVFSIELGPL